MQRFLRAISATILLACATSVQAQQPPATLRLTVVDPTGAVLAGAKVSVTGTDETTKAITREAETNPDGVATVGPVPQGRYAIEASFPAFQTRKLPDVRLRSGENKQVLLLPLEKMETTVEVGQDKQEAAAGRGTTFGTTLTREQIEALSDDPAELQQQLQDMAGPGAVIRIDSFEGGALPAKAMIKSIRISRDQFAAEYHSAGGVAIDIVTQPGIGRMQYFSNLRARSSGLDGRSPFTPTRGPEQNVNYGFGMFGALKENKASFGMNIFGIDSYDTPALNVALGTGIRSESLRLRAPRDVFNMNANVDYAVTLDQLVRFGFSTNRIHNGNMGVGGYDEEDRAFSLENRVNTIRVQQLGPVGRRAFLRSRLLVSWTDSDRQSAFEGITVQVHDAFTRGGAQVSGGQHSKSINGQSDLDYVRGRHSLRAGAWFDSGWHHSNDTSNYLGTYIFENLDDYLAGQPRSFTRRIGDPNISYRTLQGAVYFQDDFRIRKNLTISPGVRYEALMHVHDYNNVAPRFGITWAPWASGRTTFRASSGIFYDWLGNNTYEQTLRVDGVRQQELNIFDPSYPDAGALGVIPPTNRYFLGSDLKSPRLTRVSAGVDEQLAKNMRVAVTYSHIRGSSLARGLNLNAPVNDIRPNPSLANIVEVVSDAESRQHQLTIDATINPGALMALSTNAPLVSWKRATVFANYSTANIRDNTDGPFSLPATGVLATEWGSAANDIRHRASLTFNNQIVRNLLLGFWVNAQSGGAYTLRTGTDDNGDLVFNDRPAGVGRNTLRMPAQYTLNTQIGYSFAFGKIATPQPPGIGVFGGGASATVRTVEQSNVHYRLNVFLQVQNLTNRANYQGYSGVLTSPFFGRPTTVSAMRKVDVGLGFSF
jgi:carboxypeptidase family protein